MTTTPTQRRPLARPGMALSPRETEVLKQMAEGDSYEEIAKQLCISVDTVRSHLKKIYIKLQAKNGPHAVAIAIGQHVIYPRDCIAAGAYAGQALMEDQ